VPRLSSSNDPGQAASALMFFTASLRQEDLAGNKITHHTLLHILPHKYPRDTIQVSDIIGLYWIRLDVSNPPQRAKIPKPSSQ
jgi:hypothetical protein